MLNIKYKAVNLLLCSICCLSLHANGLLKENNSLLSEKNTLIHESKSLSENNTSLVHTENSLLNDENSLVESGSSLLDEETERIGIYENIVTPILKGIEENSVEKNETIVAQDVYINNYGSFLESVTSKDPLARNKFVTYFVDWQWSGQADDFFSYASYRAEYEKKVELCYDNAIKRFGAGTAIIATTWIVSLIVPGGTIIQASIIVIAKATTIGAISGAAFDGVFSAGKAIYQGKSTEEIVYETINGAASGYLFGVVAGLAEGTVHVALLVKNAKRIKDMYIIFGEQIYDKSGKLLVDLSDAGKECIKTAAKLLEGQGDDVLNALIKVAEKNPKQLSTAIQYMNAKGVNGIYDVLQWEGTIPAWITKDVIKTAEKIAKSSLKASMDSLRNLPRIRLTTTQLDKIRQNPSYLKELVEKTTGKTFNEGYLEFFIRLTKQNPNQAQEIWNYSKAVRDVIKDAIRAGGVHEWLMCENFVDFLIDSKWRREGPYLAKILSVLTQNSDDVYLILNDGTKWTHTLESQLTFGNPNNKKALIHNLIREVIEKSNNAEELLVNLERMVKEKYPKEVYEGFSIALANCFI